MCPLVANAVNDMNPYLKTLNGKTLSLYVTYFDVLLMLNIWETFYPTAVVAKVDQYAEIEYSMVSSPTIANSSVDLSLKVLNSISL